MHNQKIKNDHTGQTSILNSILEILQKTENKIQELQKFSSNDFSFLNQKFLSFHKKSKSLVNIISDLTEHLNTDFNSENKLFVDLLKLVNEAPVILSNCSKHLLKLKNSYGKINENVDFMLVPLNNYKQNLITLKLLSTNLKIDKTGFELQEHVSVVSDNIIQILENICLFFPKIEKYAEEYKTSNRVTLEHISQFITNVVDVINFEINEIKDFLYIYLERNDHFNGIIKEIEKSKIKNQQNVDTIITNLQYQDIIRQRIEHIQETHQELINDLKDYLSKNDLNGNQINILAKIKDIVGLQSAHLIHINQEFQKAIDTISIKIKSYNEQLTSFVSNANKILDSFSIFDNFMTFKKENSDNFFKKKIVVENFIVDISRTISIHNTKSDELSKYVGEVFDINDQIKKLGNNLSKVKENKTLERVSDLLSDNLHLSDKIESNIVEIDIINKETTEVFLNVSQNLRILIDSLKTFEKSSLINNLYNITESIRNIRLQVDRGRIEQRSLNVALNELEYYHFFEKNVNEIIEYLNNINGLFEELVDTGEFNLNENIDHVKGRYTTKKEHTIHEKFSLNSNMKPDQNKSIDKSEIEDDSEGIEFF